MSINELIREASKFQTEVIIFFVALPVLTFLLLLVYKQKERHHIGDYVLSILIYLVSIPGCFSFALVFYNLLILKGNILNVDLVIYFLPLISMLTVFGLIARKTDFLHLPGFGRLSGLLLMMVLTCIVLFVLHRMHFFVGFFASIESLAVIAIAIFILFKVAAAKIMGGKNK
ncbi:hypothetical protein [Algicola sagamiensis]|uniref:hypothetical protein n=1 Tax=Algicola sagamiensis TaxID=163869 RepID=UPI00036A31A9|nr:hypothetical protein [Algicola sagamiensis]